MSPEDANREAPYWMGFARSLSRRFYVPPLYTRGDWEAEAYLGLATALDKLEPRGPRPTYAPFIRTVVTNHLKRCIRNVLSPPWTGGHPAPPRAHFGRCKSLDESYSFEDGDGPFDLYDSVPNPASPDPLEALLHKEAIEAPPLLQDVRGFADGLIPEHRRALGYLLRGMTTWDVAALTGCTEGSARGVRTRLKKRLAAHLESAGYAP